MKTELQTQQEQSSDSLTIGMRAGPWIIESQLGRGGMGTVYAVTHEKIGKRAALKVMHRRLHDPDANAIRMLQEAQVVNAIGHPNIVDIFDVGTTADDRPYIVMERLAGRALSEHSPDVRESLAILAQIADALIAAHAVGVVHRDLKPDNIFLCDGPPPQRVKLLDWGIARVMHVPIEVTFEGQLVGTPRYIAPEQARGERVTPKTDVYSLGVVAYELLLGQPPFDAETPTELMAMHLLLAPPPPRTLWPNIPTRLETLLHAMLAKQPEARPSMRDIAATIAACVAEMRAPRKPPALIVEDEPKPRRKRRGQRRWPTIIAAASVLALGAVFFALDRAPLRRGVAARLPQAAESLAAPAPARHRVLPSPVVEDCADPSVLRDGERWYMTCTGGSDGNLFPIHESSDLATWKHVGWIFSVGQQPAWATGNYWAPELHRTPTGIAAYFSMRAGDTRRNAVGVATAKSPLGPYRDRGGPLVIAADGGGTSDAHVFVDTDGKRYLYFKHESRPSSAIWMMPLSDDGLGIREDPRPVLEATEPWERRNVEAPSVVREGVYYYLFYSGSQYCDADYAVGVARATSPSGPFEKLPVPLVRSTARWFGPGHAAVVTAGEHDQRYLAYHAYRASEGTPTCKADAPADNDRRHVRIVPMIFDGDWPLVDTAPHRTSLR